MAADDDGELVRKQGFVALSTIFVLTGAGTDCVAGRAYIAKQPMDRGSSPAPE
jgi:hypothetical protein